MRPVPKQGRAEMQRTPFMLVLIAGLTACGGRIALAQTAAITATTVEHSRLAAVSDEAFARHWGLTAEAVAKYRAYMNVEGRYFYAHLDPVMVLGIIETDPVQRSQYAENYLKAERQRVSDQTGFAALVAATQLKRFGLEPVFDFSTLPQAAQSPGYWRARADRLGGATPTAYSPRPANGTHADSPVSPQAGDIVDLLVDAECAAACYEKLNQVLKTPGVRVQVYGRGFKETQGLLAWLEKWPVPAEVRAAEAARIAPRHFDPMVFGGWGTGKSAAALLRRQRAVWATL